MGLFIGGAIVVGLFILTMAVGWALGCFKSLGDDSENIYNKKTVEEVALMIYQEQMLAARINQKLDEIPENWLTKLIPVLGSKHHIKKRATQLGCKL